MSLLGRCSVGGHRPLGPGTVMILIFLVLTLILPKAAPAVGTWSETGPLAKKRYDHTATLLADGRVLVFGGLSDTFPVLPELYDPSTGTWHTTSGLPEACREGHTATLLADGGVLITGGFTLSPAPLASVALFNPTTHTWTTSIPALNTARFTHTATRLADGRVLVAGGCGSGGASLAAVEIFNPGDQTWSTAAPLNTARYDHSATLLPDGRVLVAGGYGAGGPLNSAEIYDPSQNVWTNTGMNLKTARYGHSATLLADGRVLVAGGYGATAPLNSDELYLPDLDVWTNSEFGMYSARHGHTATRLPDGRVLVAGGYDGSNQLASVDLFNPQGSYWSEAEPLSRPSRWHSAAALADGRVLVAGGLGPGGAYLPHAEIYDPLNFVKNGSFETSSADPGGGGANLSEGSSAIDHWVVEEGGVSLREDLQPQEGRRVLELNGTDAGGIRQIFLTLPGKWYRLTFAMAGYPGAGPAVKSLRVSAAGQSKDFSFDTTGKNTDNMGWTMKSWNFKAQGVVTTLRFRSLTGTVFGPAVDRVRVIQINAPSPPLLLLLD